MSAPISAPSYAAQQATDWCFTLNNPTSATLRRLELAEPAGLGCVHLVWQQEQAPGGPPHIQGYAKFGSRVRASSVFLLLGTRATWARPLRRTVTGDTWEAARERYVGYCQKPETRIPGTTPHNTVVPDNLLPPALPVAADLGNLITPEEVFTIPDDDAPPTASPRLSAPLPPPRTRPPSASAGGTPLREVLDFCTRHSFQDTLRRYPMETFKHTSALKMVAGALIDPRTEKTDLFVFQGATGTGKTRAAMTCFDGTPFVMMNPPKKGDMAWFDGYSPDLHSTVIIDDFRGTLPLFLLLNWADRIACSVKVHNSVITFAPKRIIITSNLSPEQWWPKTDLRPFYRRVTSHLLFAPDHIRPILHILQGNPSDDEWPRRLRGVKRLVSGEILIWDRTEEEESSPTSPSGPVSPVPLSPPALDGSISAANRISTPPGAADASLGAGIGWRSFSATTDGV